MECLSFASGLFLYILLLVSGLLGFCSIDCRAWCRDVCKDGLEVVRGRLGGSGAVLYSGLGDLANIVGLRWVWWWIRLGVVCFSGLNGCSWIRLGFRLSG